MKKTFIAVFCILLATQFHGQIITTIAGNGTFGYNGDGDSATLAQLRGPYGIALDISGNIYIAEQSGNRIRKINTNGIITTIAGDGTFGNSGDGGAAVLAKLYYPTGVAVDVSGNVFIADGGNNRIRKVDTNGIITTIAGNGASGYSGDGGAAVSAKLNNPRGVSVDAVGNTYIADLQNNVIRKVDANGTITTIAGNGTAGYSGNNAPALLAQLNYPSGTAVDALGNVYIADAQNYSIRKVDVSGIITTIAGNGTIGIGGDGGPATSAQLTYTAGVAIDASGNLYIADKSYSHIRKVNTSGIITSIAGNNITQNIGDGGAATLAHLNNPTGVAVDTSGNVFIADLENQRIRKIGVLFSCYWIGSVSTEWENPANWSSGLLPSGNANVFINSGTVILNSNATIWSLTIAPNISVTINSPYRLSILH